jgi:mono/diheme cytochrome c family protein
MRLWLAALALHMACLPAGFAFSRSKRESGAAVFTESGCSHCHSIRSVGGHKGPDLSSVGRRLNEADMRRRIVEGSKVMPPFGEELQKKDLADLLAYLHSCREKTK